MGAYVEIGSDSESTESLDTIPEYAQQGGCSVSLEQERPLEYFSLLITDDRYILTQANLSARQFIGSHEHSVGCITSVRFLAIKLIMGLVRYPQMEHCWATQWHTQICNAVV